MGSSEPRAGERIVDVSLDEDMLSVRLADGRVLSVPLAWYPRLLHATAEQRRKWVISAAGYGIHWPDLDEDLSSEGLLRGERFVVVTIRSSSSFGEPFSRTRSPGASQSCRCSAAASAE